MERVINDAGPEILIFDRKMREAKSYWLEKLSGPIGESNLRLDYERPAHYSTEEGVVSVRLDGALYQKLCKLTGEKPFLIYAALMAALKVCLYKYTGSRSIVVGSPSLKEESNLSSHSNALAVLDEIPPQSSFKEFLLNVRQTLLDAYARQTYPFSQVVKNLECDLAQNKSPLFDVTLELTEIHHRLPDLKNDITIRFDRQPDCLLGHIFFNQNLFKRETIERFAKHFANAIRSALDNPQTKLADLEITDRAERHQLLVEWNAKLHTKLNDTCLQQVFEEQVLQTPEAVALMTEEESLSYNELNERANQLAHHLRRLSVNPEQRVGVCLERSMETVVALLGVIKAGGVYVPLDPSYPQERLAFMLEDAGVSVVLTQERVTDTLPEHNARVLCLDSNRAAIAGESRDNPSAGVLADNLAYVIYTSGSTGKPKGVGISHAAAVNHFATVRQSFGLAPSDRVLQFASLNFDVSLEQIFAPLFSGACVVLRGGEMWGASDLARRIGRLGLTVLNVPPAYWHQFITDVELESYGQLRLIIVGGDVLLPESLRLWERSEPGSTRLLNAYGPTEAVITSTLFEITPELLEDRHLKRVPIGRAVGNRSIYILDDSKQVTPVGVAGELLIGGDMLARGYLGRPDLTAERFVPNPFSNQPGARLYSTGDLAYYLPSGDIEFIGRVDNQVKLRGFRIELGEIEAVLAAHPGLRESAVVMREDEPGEQRLVAYFVPRQAAAACEAGPLSSGPGRHKRGSGMELWPSIGEYWVYDELTYYVMTNDELKINKYNAAINQMVLDKKVLDLGTGKDALLARLCAQAGAKVVYALEALDEAYQQAQETIERLNLKDRIILLKGDSRTVELPEKVDVCITEIFCSIGGAGGAGAILNDAKRFLEEGGKCIPQRSITKIAAAELPDELLNNLGLTDVSAHYIERIFAEVGHRFDLRLCIDGFPPSHVVSTAGVFEDLDFREQVVASYERAVTLTIERDAKLDGFLVWLNLETKEGEVIDILAEEYGWMPVFFPVFHPALKVSKGDFIEILCTGTLSEDNLHPDYRIKGRLFRQNTEVVEFEYVSFHHSPSFKKSWFYRQLFPRDSMRIFSADSTDVSTDALKQYLSQHLPEYMLPASYVVLDALPLMPNGKVDRRALPAPTRGQVKSEKTGSAPGTPVEEVLSGIWAEVLGLAEVNVEDNFFDLGGHSLKATQAMSRVRDVFQVNLPLRSIFEAPHLGALSEYIETAMRAGQTLTVPPIERVSRDRVLPLSFAQQRLWFLDKLQPGSAFYNIPAALRLDGKLDVDALRRALSEIVRRHESLRTTFEMVDGEPVQVIAPPTALPLPLTDLRPLPRAQREAECTRLVAEEARQPFDLARAPAVRASLLRLEKDEHLLLFTMHHIVCDGWSMGVLIHEFAALYQAFSQGEPSPLSELDIQYPDFAHWQRDWLRGEVLETQLSYWKRQLANAPHVLELPLDKPRPAVQTFHGAGEAIKLSAGLTAALKELSRREGTTLFMTLLAAFKVLLHRYTEQRTIVVGSPIANRNRAQTESLIGLFVNTLVLSTDLTGNPTVRELLGRVREVTLGAYAHQDLPFEKLVEELQPERSLSRSPLFQTMFVLQNAPREILTLPGLSLSLVPSDGGTAKFELLLSLTETAEGLAGALEYNTDLFEPPTIQRLLKHYEQLLESFAVDAEQRILDLPMMTEAGRLRLLSEWNETARDYRQDICIHRLFELQAERTPEAEAIVSELGSLTYRELNERANQLAHYLQRKLSVHPEQRVGVCLKRSPEILVGLLGILKAGGVYVPLDQAYPEERLSFMLEDSQVRTVVTQESMAGKIPPGTTAIHLDTNWGEIAQESRRNPTVNVVQDNLAYVIYTSGSTGRPKGVAIEHRSTLALIQWAEEVFSPEELDGVLASTSICFDLSVFELFVPLCLGGKVILAENALQIPTLSARLQVKMINTVPSAMAELVSIKGVPPSVRVVNLAGEQFQHRLVEEIYELPDVEKIYNLYGPTEDTTYTTCQLLKKNSSEPITIGRPIANTKIYILNHRLQPTPVGVAGELCIGGQGLSRGYLNRADLTADKFIPNPFAAQPGERLYKTGDRARYREDGAIEFLGRIDGQIKLRGFRIELGEIESTLQEHPGVRACVVTHRHGPEQEPRLDAYVVLEPQAVHTMSDLRGWLRHKLPAYMIPSAFVQLEKMPLTANGKIDRNALPDPDGFRRELTETYVAPRTELERAITTIWQEALRLDKLGIDDNFFDLGGHSLLLIRVTKRVGELIGRELPIINMFEYPTINALAAFLSEEQNDEAYFAQVNEQALRQRAARERQQASLRVREMVQ